jgi:CheY-like chemotaxis protein
MLPTDVPSTDLAYRVDRILLARYCPAAIVFDEAFQVRLWRGPAEELLLPAAAGSAMPSAGEHLKAMLRESVARAACDMAPVARRGVSLERAGAQLAYDVLVVPLGDDGEQPQPLSFLVIFEEHVQPRAVPLAAAPTLSPGVPPLRRELERTTFQTMPLDRPGRTDHYASLFAVRVLVVDDDPGTLAAVIDVLKLSGADVQGAASAAAARHVLERFSPQAIVCDISMPDEDGNMFMRKLRAGAVDVPALALTALSSEEDRQRASAAGFQIHLAKPVDIDRLRNALVDLLSRPREVAV